MQGVKRFRAASRSAAMRIKKALRQTSKWAWEKIGHTVNIAGKNGRGFSEVPEGLRAEIRRERCGKWEFTREKWNIGTWEGARPGYQCLVWVVHDSCRHLPRDWQTCLLPFQTSPNSLLPSSLLTWPNLTNVDLVSGVHTKVPYG